MRLLRIMALAGFSLFSSGCFFSKKPAVLVPVAAPPSPSPTPVAADPSPVPQQTAPATPPEVKPATTKPAPVVAKPKPATVPPPSTPIPTPPAITPAPPPTLVPTPSLGAMLTTDQRTKLEAAYQADLRQANAVLNRLNGRSLTSDQTENMTRASAFIRQAAQFHDRDLTTAAELARRARVLTNDLAGALK